MMSSDLYRTIGLATVISTISGVSHAEDSPTLYTVATAHLDTQWNWTIKDTIEKYIPNTLISNFKLFENYPDYKFNFEGAFRYQLAKEYYPDLYKQLKEYIREGRWNVAGSSWDAVDTHIPSPESLFRNILYGEGYFQKEFGKKSRDIFLPDCFGFGYSLPSIAVHSGLLGFSTQKLTWGSVYGIPFDIGKWTGPDGSSVAAALNAGDYNGSISHDLSNDGDWLDRIDINRNCSGVSAGYMYHGIGDVGGAPRTPSVVNMEKSIKGKGPIKVLSASSDQLFKDLTPSQWTDLEEFRGELLLTTHGTGCYTSKGISKRWNRQNEVLADAAERANITAEWLGGVAYPREALTEAWKRFLWHQFHDDLTGTSIPEAYRFSWNDYILSLNTFAGELETGVSAVARAMDTECQGKPLLVYNPQAHTREDVVEVQVDPPKTGSITVFGPDGKEVSSQLVEDMGNGRTTLAFIASMPPLSYAVFDIRNSSSPCTITTGLRANRNTLENDYYRVTIDDNGDISDIYDKKNRRQLLSEPLRWELFNNRSDAAPAWEILYDTVASKPREYVTGPVDIRIVENGPARVALEITRKSGYSTFIQRISLACGDAGDMVKIDCRVEWYSGNTLLKAAFPMTVSNPKATYNLGVGTIERVNNTPFIYEVPGQQWADLTDNSGDYGVSILTDYKYGWDKPSDNTLRLTLIHTPSGRNNQQNSMDFGENNFSYAIYGHAGSWMDSGAAIRGVDYASPLRAFFVQPHHGQLGKAYSFASVTSSDVDILALKKAEDSNEVIVRLQEINGKKHEGLALRIGSGIAAAREVNGQEEPVGPAQVEDGRLVTDMDPYATKTFALKIRDSEVSVRPLLSAPMDLPYNIDAVSYDSNCKDGEIPGKGYSIPGELFPSRLFSCGIDYRLGPSADGDCNAVSCRGQVIQVPRGAREVYILMASADGDKEAMFEAAGRNISTRVQDISDDVGGWDNYAIGKYGWIKKDPVAYTATHRHNPEGNVAYEYCYMFTYRIEVPEGVDTLKLPDSPGILVFAASAVQENSQAISANALYDIRDARKLTALSVSGGSGSGSYPVGTRIEINAAIPVGYIFDKWEGDGVDHPASPDAIVTVAEKPIKIKALYRPLGVNLALHKKVKASQSAIGEPPERAVDGSIDTFGSGNSKWCANQPGEKWLMVDLTKEIVVSAWVVRHAGAGGESRGGNTRDFELQVSSDGKLWHTVDSVTNNELDVTCRKIKPVKTRYVRLNITNPGADGVARIYEFEVYSS